MAEVVLFHHVHTADLFEGRTFESIEAGQGFVEKVGFDEIVDRGVNAVDGLSAEVVYAGFSLGVVPAQKLAQTRPGARGALLFHSFVSPEYFGPWPDGVPGPDPLRGCRPVLRRRGRHRRRPRTRRRGRGRGAVPVSRRSTPLRRQFAAVVRRGRRSPVDETCPRLPRRPPVAGRACWRRSS
jgi:hypothetical protein